MQFAQIVRQHKASRAPAGETPGCTNSHTHRCQLRQGRRQAVQPSANPRRADSTTPSGRGGPKLDSLAGALCIQLVLSSADNKDKWFRKACDPQSCSKPLRSDLFLDLLFC